MRVWCARCYAAYKKLHSGLVSLWWHARGVRLSGLLSRPSLSLSLSLLSFFFAPPFSSPFFLSLPLPSPCPSSRSLTRNSSNPREREVIHLGQCTRKGFWCWELPGQEAPAWPLAGCARCCGGATCNTEFLCKRPQQPGHALASGDGSRCLSPPCPT